MVNQKPRETVWVSLATSRRFARLWRICFLRWWRRLIYSSLHIQLMLCGSAILAICLTVMHFLPRSSFALLDIFLVDLSSTWQTCLRLCECSVWEPCVNSVCCVSVCVCVCVWQCGVWCHCVCVEVNMNVIVNPTLPHSTPPHDECAVPLCAQGSMNVIVTPPHEECMQVILAGPASESLRCCKWAVTLWNCPSKSRNPFTGSCGCVHARGLRTVRF